MLEDNEGRRGGGESGAEAASARSALRTRSLSSFCIRAISTHPHTRNRSRMQISCVLHVCACMCEHILEHTMRCLSQLAAALLLAAGVGSGWPRATFTRCPATRQAAQASAHAADSRGDAHRHTVGTTQGAHLRRSGSVEGESEREEQQHHQQHSSSLCQARALLSEWRECGVCRWREHRAASSKQGPP